MVMIACKLYRISHGIKNDATAPWCHRRPRRTLPIPRLMLNGLRCVIGIKRVMVKLLLLRLEMVHVLSMIHILGRILLCMRCHCVFQSRIDS